MVKKSCSKHSQYVYKCRDCRIANGEEVDTPAQKSPKEISEMEELKKKNIEANLDELDDEDDEFTVPIKKVSSRSSSNDSYTPGSRGPGGPGGPNRFRYTKPISRKRRVQLIGILIISLIIATIISLYAVPSWWARISLQEQLYNLKAGGLPYWNFLVLDYWSTSFIFNKIGLIGALIGCTIMSLPPDMTVLTLIGRRFGSGRPTLKKALIFWWTAGFALFYFVGQMIDGFSYFSLVMYMAENGTIDVSPNVVFIAMGIILNQLDITDMEAVFVYNNLYLPIIGYVFGIICLRLVLNIISTFYLHRNDYRIASNISFLFATFAALSFFSIPMNSYDGLGLTLVWAAPIAMIGLFILGIFLRYLHKEASGEIRILEGHRKKVVIAAVITVICILIPVFTSIPLAIGINNNFGVWQTQRWQVETQKQIAWTQAAGGLDVFVETREIDNLTDSRIESDEAMVQSIRQYDKDAAVYAINSYVQSPFESVGDSDIVYINNKEYWVAPKTLKSSLLLQSDIYRHTNMYDHVEGFVAIDTFTGGRLPENLFNTTFGVNYTHPIFFGEHESTALNAEPDIFDEDFDFFSDITYYGSYDDDILLNTGWVSVETNYRTTFNGEPDGSLSGLPAFWFTTEMGLFTYGINESFKKEFLVNRNIQTRVNSILLPGLWTDNDPYLVFDPDSHRMYYAVSICTAVPIASYSRSDILRFLGVCLVDVASGELLFYRNPVWEVPEKIASDPTYNIWKIYMEKYNWQSVPDWLIMQLRYPEDLFEIQLGLDYTYHVTTPSSWYSNSQFFTRPQEGDLFYVELDLGSGLEFVGVDLVQRKGSASTILAGLYVLRHGNNFGEAILYTAPQTGAQTMIGPAAARSSFQGEASQIIELISGADFGNTLLYPLNNSLYYFIPTYATTGTENKLQVLQLAGFVNAFNLQEVGYGDNALLAYQNLNFTTGFQASNANVTATFTAPTSIKEPDYATIRIAAEVINLNDTLGPYDVVVNISVRTDIANISVFGAAVPTSNFTWGLDSVGMNFTVIDRVMEAGEGFIVNAKLTTDIGSVYSSAFFYQIVLIVDGKVIYTSALTALTVFHA